ncbi:hypothetical protein AB0876_10875 [Mycobacterium sp. NPDC049093]
MTDRANARTTSSSDIEDIEELVTEWVQLGWRLAPGATFDFRALLGRFYDWHSPGVVLHDNADPRCRIAHSAAEYAAAWDSCLAKLAVLSNTVDDGPYVVVSGDLAVVDVCFTSRFEFDGGHTAVEPTRSSLALRRHGDHWLIFREHGSALRLRA